MKIYDLVFMHFIGKLVTLDFGFLVFGFWNSYDIITNIFFFIYTILMHRYRNINISIKIENKKKQKSHAHCLRKPENVVFCFCLELDIYLKCGSS